MSLGRPRSAATRLYESVRDPVETWLDRNGDYVPFLQLLPGIVWVTALLGGALAIVAVYSVLETAPVTDQAAFTLDHYVTVLTTETYLRTYAESFAIAVVVTAVSLAVAYPAAYFIAFMDSRYRNLYILLLILPFWINLIVRTFAWQLILGPSGLINYLLVDLTGVLVNPLQLRSSWFAIAVGLVHVFMPFAVIPLYTSIRRLDRSQVEAARNLGANRLQSFYEVTLPLTTPGLAASTVIVFVLSFGSFVIPDMLGGQNVMIGNIIARQFESFNWALGSAMAVLFVVTVVTLVYLFNRFVGLQELYGGESA